jgi:hypothetical protein
MAHSVMISATILIMANLSESKHSRKMKRILFLISAALFLLSYQGHCQTITDTGTLRSALNADIVTNGSKLITASKLNRVMNGILNTMHSYGVDSAYIINPDTLVLTRRGGYSNYKIKLPGLGSGAESDPTVSGAAKAIVNGDTTNWSTAYRKRLSNLSFDSASKILTVTLSDGTEFKDTINIVGGGGGGTTNLGQSRTSTTYTVTSSSGVPTTLQPADNSNAGVLTSNQKKLLDTLANPDSVRLYRKPGSDSVFLCVKPYPYTLESCKFQYKDTLGSGSGGSGDVVGPSSATDGQLVKQNGTTGKVVNNYTGTGYVKTSTGVPSPVTTIPNADIVSFKTYPAESQIGTIYEKDNFTEIDLAQDFQGVGGDVFSLSSGKIRSVSSTVAWTTYGRFLPYRPTLLPKWSFTVEYTIVSALAGNVGMGPAIRSNNVNGANFGYMSYLSASSSTATPHLAKEDGTSDQTGTTFTISVGDKIRMVLSFDETVMTLTAQNLTTSSAVSTVTKTFVATTTPYVPNTGTLGFSNFSGTYDISYLKFSSTATKNPTLAIAADSKGQIFAGTFANRFPNLLNTNYPTTLNYSGGGDQLKDFLDKKIEVMNLNPEQWWIILGSNDLRYGSSLTTTLNRLATIDSWFKGTQTRVYYSVIPEDSTAGHAGIGLTAFKNYMASLYASQYIDLWTNFSTTNVLKAIYNSGDDVHPNATAHTDIAAAAVSSGLITTISANRRTNFNTSGKNIALTGDQISIVPWGKNNVLRVDDSSRLAPSMIYHDVNKIVVSPNLSAATAFTGALATFDGSVATKGNNGAIIWADRTSANYFAAYSNNDELTFTYNGAAIGPYLGGSGRLKIGTGGTAIAIKGALNINLPYTFTANTDGVALNIEDVTYTSPTGGFATFNGNYVGIPTINAAAAASFTDATSLTLGGAPVAGTNMTLVNRYTFRVLGGNSTFNGNVGIAANGYLNFNTTLGTSGYGVRDNSGTMEYKNSGGAWAAFSSGGGITGTLTSGRIPYATGTSTVADNSNFLWDNTNQRLSIGTTTAVGHLNVGGNVTWSGSQAGLQAYFLGATYNDNTTATSGTAAGSANPILIGAPTFTATNTGVIQPNAYTMYISKPIAGTNVTIQQNRALIVEGLQTTSFYVQVNGATDANYTITSDDYYINLPTITANRTVTLPASPGSGRKLIIKNKNSAGFAWQFSTAVKDGADASVTNLVNDTVYELIFDGTDWNIVN